MGRRKNVFLRYATLPLLAGVLAACTGGAGTPGKVTLQGAIGVAEQQTNPLGLSSLAAPKALGVEGLNQAILSAAGGVGLQTQSEDGAPIRGLNASVLSSYLNAQAGAKPLFGLDSQSVLAVSSSGEVLGEADIQSDGTWALEVETAQWSEAGTIGLVQGYEYDNGTPSDLSDDYWVCTEPLEYETDQGDIVPALFGASSATSTMGLLATKSLGLFNYHQDTANPASLVSGSDITPVFVPDVDKDNDGVYDYLSCGSADKITYASVTADFNWAMPSGIDEAFMYTYGVAFGLEVSNVDYPEFVSVAALDALGVMEMEVVIPSNTTRSMSLVMTDVGFYDETKFDMPLTPTFDLNAAIRHKYPDQPRQIPVDDVGYEYGPLGGHMAYIEGTIYGTDGGIAPGAIVLAVLDSAEILDFNLAIADQNGEYQLLLPATDSSLAYHIVAVNPEGSAGGFPINIPWFNEGDQYDYRYAINAATVFSPADVQLHLLGSQ